MEQIARKWFSAKQKAELWERWRGAAAGRDKTSRYAARATRLLNGDLSNERALLTWRSCLLLNPGKKQVARRRRS